MVRQFDDDANAEEIEAEGIQSLNFIEVRTEKTSPDPKFKNIELNFSKADVSKHGVRQSLISSGLPRF